MILKDTVELTKDFENIFHSESNHIISRLQMKSCLLKKGKVALTVYNIRANKINMIRILRRRKVSIMTLNMVIVHNQQIVRNIGFLDDSVSSNSVQTIERNITSMERYHVARTPKSRSVSSSKDHSDKEITVIPENMFVIRSTTVIQTSVFNLTVQKL